MTRNALVLEAAKEYARKGAWKTADRTLHEVMADTYNFDDEEQEMEARELQVEITSHVALTYEQLMDLALKHYNKGGDSTYECWEERDYQEHGPMSKYEALRMFAMDYDIEMDRMGW